MVLLNLLAGMGSKFETYPCFIHGLGFRMQGRGGPTEQSSAVPSTAALKPASISVADSNLWRPASLHPAELGSNSTRRVPRLKKKLTYKTSIAYMQNAID